ncbi:hypothetical protein ACIQC2_17880 [Streptomyces paradoxus]|uniref:hypothetical protein n=1 Tax=Streptomyces paradoxus TaxID=66375 RepID=UPI00381CE768
MSGAPKASKPTWPTSPEGGWTADDLDRLPNLPPHTELIDGSLVFVSPQTVFHERATGAYTGINIFRERMKVDVPFPAELDLTQIRARRDRTP